MDWSKGFTATYKMETVIKRNTDEPKSYEIVSGSVEKGADSELMESASLTITEPIGEKWIRIYLEADQAGHAVHVPIFTGLTSSPERNLNGTHDEYKVTCYSVLKPAKDILLPRGYYVPAGSSAEKAKEILSVIPFEIVIDGESPVTTSNIIAENGETRLSMALKVLNALGWKINIMGDGTVVFHEAYTEATATIDRYYDIMETSVTDMFDYYECPNVFRAESNGLIAVSRDDDPLSPLSTITRGREIWQEETGVKLASGEDLQEYAKKKLKEKQSPSRKLTYTRRFVPDILPGSVIHINYPGVGLAGDFKVKSQSLELGHGCRTKEEVYECN